jgi:hypothetical protein
VNNEYTPLKIYDNLPAQHLMGDNANGTESILDLFYDDVDDEIKEN